MVFKEESEESRHRDFRYALCQVPKAKPDFHRRPRYRQPALLYGPWNTTLTAKRMNPEQGKSASGITSGLHPKCKSCPESPLATEQSLQPEPSSQKTFPKKQSSQASLPKSSANAKIHCNTSWISTPRSARNRRDNVLGRTILHSCCHPGFIPGSVVYSTKAGPGTLRRSSVRRGVRGDNSKGKSISDKNRMDPPNGG